MRELVVAYLSLEFHFRGEMILQRILFFNLFIFFVIYQLLNLWAEIRNKPTAFDHESDVNKLYVRTCLNLKYLNLYFKVCKIVMFIIFVVVKMRRQELLSDNILIAIIQEFNLSTCYFKSIPLTHYLKLSFYLNPILQRLVTVLRQIFLKSFLTLKVM